MQVSRTRRATIEPSRRPGTASEKRQGTKSREVGADGAAVYGDLVFSAMGERCFTRRSTRLIEATKGGFGGFAAW